MKVITQTNITACKLLSRGKVRDIYELDDSTLLIITTDRMSAFDVIMSKAIPYKGVVLNQITIFWMKKFSHIVPNHLIETEVEKFPKILDPWKDELDKRAVLVKKAKTIPIECIVRGYITGSGWKDYQKTGKLCGYTLPQNLQNSSRLENPLFTPSTKAELGQHDENITLIEAEKLIGEDLLKQVKNISLSIYKEGRDYALENGIIVADTKFEFGLINGKLYLIDEVLTPDSSRFWPKDKYVEGKEQESLDKQFLRNWLSAQVWDKTPPPPHLPDDIVKTTAQRYKDIYNILTKNNF